MPEHKHKPCGLIFAGGQSTRMGQSKSHLTIHDQPQYEYLLGVFEKIGLTAFISCRKEQRNSFPENIPCIIDKHGDIGPIAGLLAAFDHDEQASWLCIACDMPLIDEQLLQEMIEKSKDGFWASCMLSPKDNRPEPFCSLWTSAAKNKLLTAIENEAFSLRELLEKPGVQHITPTRPETLSNINTREDLNHFINRSL